MIGLVIFVILVVIQFVVITKGATRIAEVAARFTLDGMPGKQTKQRKIEEADVFAFGAGYLQVVRAIAWTGAYRPVYFNSSSPIVVGSVGLPLNIQLGAFYNVVKPEFGPDWSTRVQVQVLLPK